MLAGEQCFPVWEAPAVLAEGLVALHSNPLPPWFAVDFQFPWLLWPFDSLDDCLEFATTMASWGFETLVTAREALSEDERRIARGMGS